MANDDAVSVTPKYLIGRVTKLTGLSIDVVRVWERRYGAIRPVRSDGGTRLYSDADIRRLKRLRHAVESGHSISQAAKLTEKELDELLAINSQLVQSSDPYKAVRERFIDAVGAMDVIVADQEIARAATLFPIEAIVHYVVSPIFDELRDRRTRKEMGEAHEKLAVGLLIRLLGSLFRIYRPGLDAPTMVSGTPVGENDELGILIASLLAASNGWKVVCVGANLPPDEIVLAVRSTNPAVLLLNITSTNRSIENELTAIARLLPLTTRVWIAGRSASDYKETIARANWTMIRNLADLEERVKIRLAR